MDDAFNKYIERYDVKSFNKTDFTHQVKEKSKDEIKLYNNMESKYTDKIYDTSYKINGMMGYMCSNCNTVFHIRTNVSNNARLTFERLDSEEFKDIESSYVKISVNYNLKCKCPVCKYYKSFIRLDNNIADAIGILNIKGYITSSSSEGSCVNGEIKNPYISFNTLDSRYSFKVLSSIENYLENTLPLSWYVDRPAFVSSYTYTDGDFSKHILPIEVRKFIPNYMFNYFSIKTDYYNREEAFKDILKWVRSLPDLLTLKEGSL